ncbi:MAG: hypothetical protein OEV12_06120, partial [Gammaproteobacteria bacterium]|nr:hypothetical protein [Gammaproteobacteria bacterium]
GTDHVTSQLGVMKPGLLKQLDSIPLPLKTEPLSLYLAWHRREDDDSAHQWLRARITGTVNSIIKD